MVKHVSVFTLKDKSEIKHFVEMLEEVGKNYPLIIKSEIGVNMSEQLPVGPHFGDVIEIIEFKNEDDLNNYPKSKEHQKLLTDGPEMETVTAIDYIILIIHSYIKEHSFKIVLFFSFYIHFYD